MGRPESVTGQVSCTPLLTSRRHIDLLRVCSAI
ncbi:putative leader peptide [Streptomyces sp. NPDC008343]